MAVDTSNASELIQEKVARVLVQPLAERSKFLSSGVSIYDTSVPLTIPKLGDPTEVTWVGESEEIPDDEELDLDEIKLLPSTMKSVKSIIRASNEAFRASNVAALDAVLKQRLVTDVAAKLDTQFFSASGDGVTQPQGLFAYSGTQTVAVGGALTLDHLLDAWGLALEADVDMSGLKWVLKPREFMKLKKLKDGDGHYILTPDPSAGTPGVFRLFGSEVIVTKRVPDTVGGTPTGRAALVDFSQIAVARDLAPSIKLLTERYAEFDQSALRVVSRYDAKPLNPEAIVKLTGIAI